MKKIINILRLVTLVMVTVFLIQVRETESNTNKNVANFGANAATFDTIGIKTQDDIQEAKIREEVKNEMVKTIQDLGSTELEYITFDKLTKENFDFIKKVNNYVPKKAYVIDDTLNTYNSVGGIKPIDKYSWTDVIDVIPIEGTTWGYTEKGFIDTVEVTYDQKVFDQVKYKKSLYATKGEAYLSFTATGKSNLGIDDFYKVTKGTKLEGIEKALVVGEREDGVNALLTYSVAALESGWGTSAISNEKNNLYGMNAVDDDPYNQAFYYNSKSDSVNDFVKRLHKYYIDQGRVSLVNINEKYSSDDEWNAKVADIMERTYNIINSK